MDAADMRVVEKFRSIDIYITQNHGSRAWGYVAVPEWA